MANFCPSVGMEVHAELATRSKMFCRCPVAFGGEPNTRVCPVCLGLPGSLPVPNRLAIEMVLKTALALNCQIAMHSVFHRKNYFYPDLAKGYQISQYGDTNPLGYDGYLDIPLADGRRKRVRIRRVHLEEDTGKLTHVHGGGSGVDYNRAGTPLMEIVTEFPPDIDSPDDAKEYLSHLREILIYLGVCDGKMEEGSLRCEPNISVRPEGASAYGTKTELKNLNSFRSVQLGVAFEVRRQIAVLEGGGRVPQETRGWNEQKESSYLMRVKEEENDYRYFPDPDLVPMDFEKSFIDGLRSDLPELPEAKRQRYREILGLSSFDSGVLIAEPEWSGFFEEGVRMGGDPKTICNWLTGDFAKMLNEAGISPRQSKVCPEHLVDLAGLVAEGAINGKMAKSLLAEAFRDGRLPSEIAKEKGATQITGEKEIGEFVQRAIQQHADIVEKYRSGNLGVKGFLVGQIMKQSNGRANPALVQKILGVELDKS